LEFQFITNIQNRAKENKQKPLKQFSGFFVAQHLYLQNKTNYHEKISYSSLICFGYGFL